MIHAVSRYIENSVLQARDQDRPRGGGLVVVEENGVFFSLAGSDQCTTYICTYIMWENLKKTAVFIYLGETGTLV